VVIVDLDHAWADVFVPEPTVPQIKIGQSASVITDAGSTLTGTIAYISPKAEFTPRNVQTADERSKQVYRVRIDVDNKDGVLKQGMPVEAEIALARGSRSSCSTSSSATARSRRFAAPRSASSAARCSA